MTNKRWTIKELLDLTTKYLTEKAIDSPRLCAEVLLSHQLKKPRIELYLEYDQPLREDEISGFRTLVRRRVNREPLQYITGHQEFWSLDLVVNPGVLIPRPETEILVDEALSLRKRGLLPDDRTPMILDVGTGSGAIAIALAKEIEGAKIWASDISPEALALAEENAQRHNLRERIRLYEGDLLEPFRGSSWAFDMIVSNPPYIAAEKFESLAPEIRCYEPRAALDGSQGGMHLIERLIGDSGPYLRDGGWLLVEMDPHQTERALNLIDSAQCFGYKERVVDYRKSYRMVKAQKKHG
jgi:release factor glutamine methyltransferase